MRALTLSIARHDAIPRTLVRTTLKTINPNLAEFYFCRQQGEWATSRSPGGEGVVCRVLGQLREARPVGVHHVDVPTSCAVGSKGDPSAIGRPRRGPVVVARHVVCEASALRAVGVHGV